MPDSAPLTGSPLYTRLVVHELARTQRDFLTRLSDTALRERMILCGSAALFGVHFPGLRFFIDLDFIVIDDWSFDLRDALSEVDMPYVQEPDSPTVCYSRKGAVFQEVRIAIEVFRRSSDQVSVSNPSTFPAPAGSGRPILVVCQEYAAYASLSSLALRMRPIDYVDFWNFARRAPTIIESAAQLILHNRNFAGEYSAPSPYPKHRILATLATLEAEWHEELQRYVHPVPAFARVAPEVMELLRQLEGCLGSDESRS